ncbi:MAG: lysylphosphatidylglycerol synthase domain-containing protein [Lactobacillaceae bacterium]|jgi:phosphatidylglycerol lysyltransferase|nr:lysylphosphatidylglycerol synthase domain-containing protein [Lactobacillaceae bacterium]
MAGKTGTNIKRVIKKIISWAGLFFFVLAAYMIYRQLSIYKPEEIKEALLSIPNNNLILACIASFLGYIALACYDFLSITYIKKKLEAWKWILTGFIGFSVSNNAGHAVISGGAIRYRFYTRWRFRATEILRMITFSGFTYLWGCCFLMVLAYAIIYNHPGDKSSLSGITTLAVTIVSGLLLLLYFLMVIFYRRPIFIKGVEFSMPSLRMAFAQIFLGATDTVLASLVLYSVVIPFVDVPFVSFLGVFVIAQILGIYSQVPGGLGVFEGLFLYMLPGEHNQAVLFGALIAYRIIYYLLPLVVSGILLVVYERYLVNLRFRRRQKPSEG